MAVCSFQAAEQVSLHVDASICRCSFSLSAVSVLVACTLGTNPLRPPGLDILERDTWKTLQI